MSLTSPIHSLDHIDFLLMSELQILYFLQMPFYKILLVFLQTSQLGLSLFLVSSQPFILDCYHLLPVAHLINLFSHLLDPSLPLIHLQLEALHLFLLTLLLSLRPVDLCLQSLPQHSDLCFVYFEQLILFLKFQFQVKNLVLVGRVIEGLLLVEVVTKGYEFF